MRGLRALSAQSLVFNQSARHIRPKNLTSGPGRAEPLQLPSEALQQRDHHQTDQREPERLRWQIEAMGRSALQRRSAILLKRVDLLLLRQESPAA